MGNGIGFPDMGQELVAQPLALRGPATRPAISTNCIMVGTTRSGLTMAASWSRRGSGTGTMPTLGSMVQNG
jgi:hypothetical protein